MITMIDDYFKLINYLIHRLVVSALIFNEFDY